MVQGSRLHKTASRIESATQPDVQTFCKGIEHPDPAIAANVMIGLIKLTNYLLDQQLLHRIPSSLSSTSVAL